MKKSRLLGAVCGCLSTVCFNANAVVVTTLGGVYYEWMEVTATELMSRNQVEAQLTDINSPLFGYQYASRALVEELFLSYVAWDGLGGWHGSQNVIDGANALVEDFGANSDQASGPGSFTGVDSIPISYDWRKQSYALYGLADECGVSISCRGYIGVFSDQGQNTGGYQSGHWGWDSTTTSYNTQANNVASSWTGSFLVREITAVPLPPALWLFSSGLLGLVGIAKRKKGA